MMRHNSYGHFEMESRSNHRSGLSASLSAGFFSQLTLASRSGCYAEDFFQNDHSDWQSFILSAKMQSFMEVVDETEKNQ